MSTIIETPDFAPPMPTETPPKNRQWSFVPAHMNRGKLHKAHWRLAPFKREPKKPGPKPDKPRFTTATHARHVYDQLDAPLALLLGMKLTMVPTQVESDYLTRAMVSRSLIALNEARVFIGRFTDGGDNVTVE